MTSRCSSDYEIHAALHQGAYLSVIRRVTGSELRASRDAAHTLIWGTSHRVIATVNRPKAGPLHLRPDRIDLRAQLSRPITHAASRTLLATYRYSDHNALLLNYKLPRLNLSGHD